MYFDDDYDLEDLIEDDIEFGLFEDEQTQPLARQKCANKKSKNLKVAKTTKKNTKQIADEHVNIIAGIIIAGIVIFVIVNIKYVLALGLLFILCFIVWFISALR